MPGPLGILIPWLLSLMISVLLAGRKLSLTRLSLSVAASQFLFHALFMLGTITPSGSAVPHVHGAPLVLPEGGSAAAAAVSADGAMWLGHAIAVIVTVAAMHRGERMLVALRELATRLVRWVRRRVDDALVSPALPVGRTLAGRFLSVRPTDAHVLATLRGRAPPILSAV